MLLQLYILPAILGGAKCLANATVNIALCFFDFDIDNLFELAGKDRRCVMCFRYHSNFLFTLGMKPHMYASVTSVVELSGRESTGSRF